MSQYKRIYAIDFDGTLAVTKFPEIIAPIQPMIDLCKELKEDPNNILIMWTCRCGGGSHGSSGLLQRMWA